MYNEEQVKQQSKAKAKATEEFEKFFK